MKIKLFLLSALFVSAPAFCQFYDSTSGLLQCPSAEMNPSGTFMITNNYLNKHTLSQGRWGYDTFAYGFDITFFSRLEIAYVCTIMDGKRRPHPSERDMILFNQDRHFSAKFLLLQEGEFGLNWMPALAAGVCDPVTGALEGNYIEGDVTTNINGFFNRMYVVASKHFPSPVGLFAAHLGYQYSFRNDPKFNAPCAGVSWVPVWLDKENFSTKAILEYDSRTVNLGVIVSVWQDRFDLMLDLQGFRWFTAGLRYKLMLK